MENYRIWTIIKAATIPLIECINFEDVVLQLSRHVVTFRLVTIPFKKGLLTKHRQE